MTAVTFCAGYCACQALPCNFDFSTNLTQTHPQGNVHQYLSAVDWPGGTATDIEHLQYAFLWSSASSAESCSAYHTLVDVISVSCCCFMLHNIKVLQSLLASHMISLCFVSER